METIELKQSVTIKNILLATDFSEVSKKALPYAAAIAGKYGSRICPVGHAPIHKQYRFCARDQSSFISFCRGGKAGISGWSLSRQ